MATNLVVPGGIPAPGGFYTKSIENSCWFYKTDSQYLSRAMGAAGDSTRIMTTSFWWRSCSNNPVNSVVLYAGTSPDHDRIWGYSGTVQLDDTTHSTYNSNGPGEHWIHIVVAIDTTQATDTDRVKQWANGVRLRDNQVGGWPAQNYDMLGFGTNTTYYICQNGATYYSYALAEFHCLDGIAKTASDFGEFKDDIWIPKTYSGSYGTNGFYLDFADSSDLGNDVSGNNNDFTANGMSTANQTQDTPTNVIPHFNMKDTTTSNSDHCDNAGQDFIMGTSGFYEECRFDVPLNGKRYWEFEYGGSVYEWYGIATNHIEWHYTSSWNIGNASSEKAAGFNPNAGDWERNNSIKFNGSAWTTGDRGCIAFDSASGKVWVGKISGGTITWENSGDPAAGTGQVDTVSTTDVWHGAASSRSANVTKHEFGRYANEASSLPTDFEVITNEDYPATDFDPETGTERCLDNFNIVKWIGDDASTQAITGVGFQPDIVFIRKRNGTSLHNQIYDSVRGANVFMDTASNAAEFSTDTNGYLSSFDADGFTVTQGATDGANVNALDDQYYAWCWKTDNTSGSSNTDGTITSTVSANTVCGFSTVSYTGNGTGGATIGHGLDSAPEMILVKNVSTGSRDWFVYSVGNDATAPEDYVMRLNTTANRVNNATAWNDTAPTSTVFSVGTANNVNTNTDEYIAYCFHSVPGFSKVGGYLAPSTSNTNYFLHCDFTPHAIWATQRTGSTSASWFQFDQHRSKGITTDTLTAEAYTGTNSCRTGYHIGYSSTLLGGGDDFIYMAFARVPARLAMSAVPAEGFDII